MTIRSKKDEAQLYPFSPFISFTKKVKRKENINA